MIALFSISLLRASFGTMRGTFLLLIILSTYPSDAVGQSLRPTFETLVPGVEVHTSYSMLGDVRFPSNGLIVHTLDSVVLIDTGWSIRSTRTILKHLKGKPVAACIVTHFHDDRTAGIPLLRKKGIPCWGTDRTRELAIEHGEAPPDARSLNDTTFVIDGTRITVLYPGPGHAPDNLVVYLPDQAVLFGGCFIKSIEARSLGNTVDTDLEHWPAAVERVRRRFPDARFVVPGHQRWGGTELMQHTIDLLHDH